MNRYFSKIRTPIKRQNAENYLLLTLFSFAASVALTRLFLEFAGYPTISSGNLHIAHVLWGGLLLFIAAILPIIFANRWVYVINSILAGIGVGLFIDEVGKFITQNNDYFYPPAAPIIYAFFLLTVLVYLQVRRSPPKDPRREFYQVLDALEEVLDHDLDANELAELTERLLYIKDQKEYPHLNVLAQKILDFLSSKELFISHQNQGRWRKYTNFISTIETKVATRRRHRAAIIGGTTAIGLVSIYHVIQLGFNSLPWQNNIRSIIGLSNDNTSGDVVLFWFALRLFFELLIGALLLASSYHLLSGNVQSGIRSGYYGLLFSLTAGNLIFFYFDQFSAILPAVIQFLFFIGVISYRRKYLVDQE